MNNIALIFAALLMILNFCGMAMADELPEETVPVMEETLPPLPAENILPDLEPVPEPETEPKAPAQSSIFDIMVTVRPGENPARQVDMAAYYMEEMLTAAAEGDVKSGRDAEKGRNAAIDAVASEEQKISFDELYLLSRVICWEAGSEWLSEDFRLCVGEVVLNRVASPEFPDTVYDVVYQKGQYSGVNTLKFANLKPGRDCVDVALRLLQGERRMVPAVVYHSGSVQGELFSMHADRSLGNTYFCLSSKLELY